MRYEKKFLFVTWKSDNGQLARRVREEGHQVKIYIDYKSCQDCYDGLLEKVRPWQKWVDWADIVVFDEIGFGRQAEALRKLGKKVIGGTLYTDKLERNREFGQREMENAGISVLPHYEFKNFKTALDFVAQYPDRYVFKPSGVVSSENHDLLFVGQEEDGSDVFEFLQSNQQKWRYKIKRFMLQRHVSGVEAAVGAFFNGKKFLAPVCVNQEYKRLFPDDLGPLTNDMGAVVYWDNPNSFYSRTLKKMEDSLAKTGYVGYFDINCIINANGVYPLEFTCFADDTEVLTKEGWKYIRNIKRETVVATLNPQSHLLEYQRVTGFISKWYKGPMVHITGNRGVHRALDCLVTPDHQMYLKKRNGKHEFVSASAIAQGSKIPRTAGWKGKAQKTYEIPGYVENHFLGKYRKTFPIRHPAVSMPMEVWLKFLGIFLAEGSIGGRNHIVNISQFSRKKEIKRLLRGFPLKVVENNKGFQISSTQLVRHLASFQFGKAAAKYIPTYVKSLPPKQIRLFLDAFCVGDGSVHRRTKQITYFSTSKRLIDDIQEMLLRCGMVGNIRKINAKGTKMQGTPYTRNHDLYWLGERKKKCDYYVDKRNIKKVDYEGRVVCIEVPNHIIYVRRNGKPFWCGNCRFGYPTLDVQLEGMETAAGEFLYRLSSGEDFKIKVKPGVQVGVCVVLPPFICSDPRIVKIYRDTLIFVDPKELRRGAPGLFFKDVKLAGDSFRVAGEAKIIAVVTGSGNDIAEARQRAYERIKKIRSANMFYRGDIGLKWEADNALLKKWELIN